MASPTFFNGLVDIVIFNGKGSSVYILVFLSLEVQWLGYIAIVGSFLSKVKQLKGFDVKELCQDWCDQITSIFWLSPIKLNN